MLNELRVSQLGVIEDLSIVLEPGLTALTGETGAGKTLVVEALELLVGGRSEVTLVRPGAAEAVVEGRFEHRPRPRGTDSGDASPSEVVLTRVIPVKGRARAYIDGRMATAAALAEVGSELVDLHGQHSHQSLLLPSAQRQALDEYSGDALSRRARRDAALATVRRLEEAMASSGGDVAAGERERQMLAFQVSELSAAQLQGPEEEDRLRQEEDRLAKAASHRAAAMTAYEALSGEGQALDRLGAALDALVGHAPLAGAMERLRTLALELSDTASDLRTLLETLEEDPQRLEEVVVRRGQLKELIRKYGEQGGGLGSVLTQLEMAQERMGQLDLQKGDREKLASEHAKAMGELRSESRLLGDARRSAAEGLAKAVEAHLARLAMANARFEVKLDGWERTDDGEHTGDDPKGEAAEGPGTPLRLLAGEDVTFALSANPGEPLLPLSKVASGGELARAMLALRLVLLERSSPSDGEPGTLVFDEVDAGVGGEAALAVGRALAELATRHQVVVVTHLAQVAAYATAQVAVSKTERDKRTVAHAAPVTGHQRVIELSRMLSGQPDSETARRHAEELLQRSQGELCS